MLNIDIYSTQAVIRSQEPLTVGLVGAAVQFRFSDQWKSLVKTAVFRQGNVTRDMLGISDQVVIPWEVLQQPGLPVHIGVYGSDSKGNVIIPTVWAVTDPVADGADPAADITPPPTPEVTQQLQNQIGSLDKLNTNAKDNLVNAINEANRGRFTVGSDGDKVNCTGAEIKAAYLAGKVPVLYDGGYLAALEGIGEDSNGQLFYTFRCHDKWGDQRVYKVSHDGTLTRSIQPAIDLSGYAMLGRVGIIGDSLSVGVEDNSATESIQDTDHSWGAYLSRTAGNPCLFLGFSGATSATWVRDKLDWALQEENRCDAYIVALGFNDLRYGTGVGSIEDITKSDTYTDANHNATPYGSYYFNIGKILRKLYAFNPDAPIFVLTNPEYIHLNSEMFNQPIREICKTCGTQYNAHLIDLKGIYGPIFEKLEAVRGPRNHFDRQTYAYMGQIIGTAITRDIQKNPGAYPRLRGYIPTEPPARFTIRAEGDKVNYTMDALQAAYQARKILVIWDGGYLANLEGIGRDENGQLFYTFRCHDKNGTQRVYTVSAPDDPADNALLSKSEINAGTASVDLTGYVQSPATAEVGQTIVVKEVDAAGKPTVWEAVDLPSEGGASQYRLIAKIEIDETNQANSWICNQDIDGNPFHLTHLVIDATIKPSEVTSSCYLLFDGGKKLSQTFNLTDETRRYILDIKLVGGVAIGRQLNIKPDDKYGGLDVNFHTTLGLSEITTMTYVTVSGGTGHPIPVGSTFHIYGY